MERHGLAAGWDGNAAAWIEWTRRGLDSYAHHKMTFLPLVPPAGRLTVEVGAGEGRVSRELKAQGHQVLAVDYSMTMAKAAAMHPVVPVRAVVGDATSLPLASRVADCVVAFMSMHDIDDIEKAMSEVGRVLVPGGKLVMAIVHPLNSAGDFDRQAVDPGRPPYVIQHAYTKARYYTNVRHREDLTMTYHGIHRPLQAYADALAGAGLVIEQLHERSSDNPEDKWSRIPVFLHIVASRRTPA